MYYACYVPVCPVCTWACLLIKDKTGRIDRIDNYRPITLARVVSKVVERILVLDKISHFLETCPNQFGSKRNLGTDTRIYMY